MLEVSHRLARSDCDEICPIGIKVVEVQTMHGITISLGFERSKNTRIPGDDDAA